MPQGQIALANTPSNGSKSALGLTDAAVNLVKSQPGKVLQANVVVALAGALSIYDSATTAGTAAANLVYASSTTVAIGTIIELDFPMQNGIVAVLGSTGQVALSYV
jgi:hypothetical protein